MTPLPEDIDKILIAKYGDNLVYTEDQFVPRIETGMPELDEWMGGGLPRGRIIELYGMESTGKSTLALEIAKRVQAAGEHVVWVDAEWSFEFPYAHSVGVYTEPPWFILLRPLTLEECFNSMKEIMVKAYGGLYILDSLAAVPPKAEIQELEKAGQIDKQDALGRHATAVSNSLRRMGQFLGQSGALLLIINQVRTKMEKGGPGGMRVSQGTTGGNALKFYAAMRWKISRGKKLENRKHPVTKEPLEVNQCTLTMRKTKVSKTENHELQIWVIPEFGVRIHKARQQVKD